MTTAAARAGGRLRLDHPATGVARLTIADPAKRNALDHELLDAIAGTLRDGLADVRCLVLTAEGPTFSAGYDIGSLPDEALADAAQGLVAHPFTAAIEALEAFPSPVVAALNGHALGGGLELAISCDIAVAAEDAKLGMPPAKLGLIYSHTGVRKFLDAIGAPRTRLLFHTGRTVGARVALEWGLVQEVCSTDELADRAVALAAEIAANAPLAVAGNKRVVGELLHARGALDAATEADLIALREAGFRSEDFAEGVRAFTEKRPPRWQGR